jgi:hypothetical protein
MYPGLSEDLSPPSGAGTAVRDGPEHSSAVDSCPLDSPAGDAPRARGCAHPVRDRAGEAPRGGRGGSDGAGRTDGGAADVVQPARTGTRLPPVGHDGTERRIERPQDPTEQTRCDRGKQTCHTVNNVRLIDTALTIRCLTDTYAGSTHATRMADAPHTPCPRGAGCSRISAFWRLPSRRSR